MANIVVTGATSFIGIHIILELLQEKQDIWAIIRPDSPNVGRLPKCENLHIVECSLENIEDIGKHIKNKIDVFFHLAWDGARIPWRDDKVLQERNYQAALRAFAVAVKMGCKRFVGAGSQAEYGKTSGNIYETYLTKPITEYGRAKLKTGKTLLEIGQENNIKVIWPRIFSVYGQYDFSETLIAKAIYKLKNKENIELTECIQNWNYLYVKDAAIMFYKLGMNSCESGIYNLASLDNRMLKSYVVELRSIIKSDSPLLFGAIPYPKEGCISFVPKIDKFMDCFPDMMFTTFSEGIRDMFI